MPDDIFTLPSLIRWLEKQPADGEYNFYTSLHCMVAQYCRSIDGRAAPPNTARALHPEGYQGLFPGPTPHERFHNYLEVSETQPWTFGAALDRARALLAKQRSTDAAVERIKADALVETEGV